MDTLRQKLESIYDQVTELFKQRRFAEARQILTCLVDTQPNLFWAHNILGHIANEEGRVKVALQHYDRAVSLNPAEPSLHWNLAMALLLTGQFPRGWQEFEWRLQLKNMQLGRAFSQPRWAGQSAVGKTILLHAEGGHGDAIQFSRYITDVSLRVEHVILECHSALVPLLGNIPGVFAAYARGQELPHFDLHCPLQSLPLVFETRLDSIPNKVPYLAAPPAKISFWRTKLGDSKILRVGLCWAGSSQNQDHRSRTLDTFAPLAGVVGVEIHSLQTGNEAIQWRPPGLNVIDHSADLLDFTDTAALISNLDLVLTVDTSIAHLAGALGKPVWVMIARLPDFRWMIDRSDSPWYPSMRLFRQGISASGYSAVACAMAVALREKVRSMHSPPSPTIARAGRTHDV